MRFGSPAPHCGMSFYRATHRILLDETDAAGVAFGPGLIQTAHRHAELALAGIGCSFAAIIASADFVLPLRRVNADFTKPVQHGDEIDVLISIEALTEHGFTILVTFMGSEAKCAQISFEHVCIDRVKRFKRCMPDELQAQLRLADN